MAAREEDGVDPRFDPMFQRGYDPEKHGTPRRRGASPPPPLHEVPPSARERAGAGASGETPRAAVEPTTLSTGNTAAHAEHAADGEHPEPSDRAPDPFRRALLILSLVSLACGLLALWHTLTEELDYSSRVDVVDRFLDELDSFLVVPLVTGGVLGLVIWLALGALRRRPDA